MMSPDEMVAEMEAEREQDDVLAHLRQSNARLARQLAQARIKTGEMVEAVYRAASDAAAGLTLPPG